MNEEKVLQRSMVLSRVANALLLLSLFLPTMIQIGQPGAGYGYHILVAGIFGPLMWQFGWLGNIALPLLLISNARWLRYVTVCCFINSIFWDHVGTDIGDRAIELLSGYYVWMTAMFISAVPLIWATPKRVKPEYKGPAW